MKKVLIIAVDNATAEHLRHQISAVTTNKVSPLARTFIEFQSIQMPYFIAVVSFLDIVKEEQWGPFKPKVPLDKLVFFSHYNTFPRHFWEQLQGIKTYDSLIFLDDAPPSLGIAPPRPSIRRQLFP